MTDAHTPGLDVKKTSTAATVVVVLVLLVLGWNTLAAKSAESERIADVLRLRPGTRLADVGAGDGEWAEKLAPRVGRGGHVFATEVDEDEVEEMQERFGEGFENVTVVLGNANDTGLPDDCCDAVLLRMVYHHFTDPARMRASLKRALQPGALIAVIDIEPQKGWRELDGVPDRGGHGVPPDDLIREMTGDGFTVVERYDDWNGDDDRFCVVFRAPGSSNQSP